MSNITAPGPLRSEDEPDTRDVDGGPRTTRRHVLTAACLAAAGGSAGCLGGGSEDSEPPEPVTLGESADCDVCGMVIAQHPGPTAEIFYADQQPADHENPARFDSTWEAFQFDFDHESWTREAFYVTDYSTVDYELREDGDQTVISTHYGAQSFVDATAVTFVAGSEVVGAMGADLIGFSAREDAQAFQDEHGGDLVEFDDVTSTMISALGT